jgi:hypothetical protein
MAATRLACASSLCVSRYCRSRRVLSKAMVACAAKSLNKQSVVGERLPLFAAQSNCPDYLIVFEQRHNEARSKTCVHRPGPKIIPMIAFKFCQVVDVSG